MINSGMMTSLSDNWETPPEVFEPLNKEFNFTLDVCASKNNAKCESYYDIDDDGLRCLWQGTCWMNPPYGRQITKWVKKAYESSLHGATVVCLIPARTDTSWWHDYCMKGEVRFIRGRIYFLKDGKKTTAAPFPSAIVIFQGTKDN